jgi:hypothetical protein
MTMEFTLLDAKSRVDQAIGRINEIQKTGAMTISEKPGEP